MSFSDPQFPNSFQYPFQPTSQQTWDYNCIAWAYGVNNKWFWPLPPPPNSPITKWFWPPNIPSVVNINSFIKLFESIGYEICADELLEEGYLKIAIYEINNTPTHAAKQLPNGLWSSKLGPNVDVSHTIETTKNSSVYGNVSVFMRRPVI
jgi:hypothetical protein